MGANISKNRQNVYQLNKKRSVLLNQALKPRKMLCGSLYQMSRYCGNPGCKCARGEKHISWYLSRRIGGRTKLKYIGKRIPTWLANYTYRYKKHQRILAEIRSADSKISRLLNGIRDSMIRTIEEVKREK